MTKSIFILSFVTLFAFGNLQAQSFDLGMLDNAMGMFKSGDKNTKVAGILGDAVMSLKDEAKSSDNNFSSKLIGQASVLGGLIPSIKKGNADMNLVQKVISTIKTLVAAQRLKSLLGGGSLLGKSSQVNSNVGLIQSGLGALGSGSAVDKLSSALGAVTKKSSKLEKTGIFANLAEKAVSKKLGTSLNLLNGLL
ncbi:hypothetical protein [uncultured Arcticibacterium sp.]|uniref:hypothetical protein n=1 Tax=uncultured Arcticibacterium sp. TaxID=2173042 RepID=UPI0030FA0517